MAKLEVKQAEVVIPPKEYVLTLNQDELDYLVTLTQQVLTRQSFKRLPRNNDPVFEAIGAHGNKDHYELTDSDGVVQKGWLYLREKQ